MAALSSGLTPLTADLKVPGSISKGAGYRETMYTVLGHRLCGHCTGSTQESARTGTGSTKGNVAGHLGSMASLSNCLLYQNSL